MRLNRLGVKSIDVRNILVMAIFLFILYFLCIGLWQQLLNFKDLIFLSKLWESRESGKIHLYTIDIYKIKSFPYKSTKGKVGKSVCYNFPTFPFYKLLGILKGVLYHKLNKSLSYFPTFPFLFIFNKIGLINISRLTSLDTTIWFVTINSLVVISNTSFFLRYLGIQRL